MTQPIYATFSDPGLAQKAAGALLDHGVKAEHLHVIFPEGYSYRADDDNDEDATDVEASAKKGISTTTVDDAKSGAAKGAGLGLAAGALAALAAVFIPGVGLVLGGGALGLAAAGAAGATAAGAVAGGVTGYLKDQGLPDEIVSTYGTTLTSGGATLTVMPGDEDVDQSTVQGIIDKYSGSVNTYAPMESKARVL
jgi:hypothetical protein